MLRRLSLACLLISGLAHAQGVTDLYQTQVPLTGDMAQARSTGLAQVLMKASGEDDMMAVPSIVKALQDPEPYITQFGTEQKDGQSWLSLRFDPKQVDTLLQQADVNVWPMAQRPTLLVWWVKNENHQRQLLWDQEQPETQQSVMQAAQHVGLPLLWPVGDMTDAMSVDVPDVTGGFLSPIAKASERYQPQGILLINENVAGDGAVALHWRLFVGTPQALLAEMPVPIQGKASGSLRGSSETVMKAVMAQLALQRESSMTNSESDVVPNQITQIKVTDLPSAGDFFQFEKWLQGLPMLSSAKIATFQGNQVIFDVQLTQPFSQLKSQLLQSQKVRWVAPLDGAETPIPTFEWQPH